MAAGLRGVQTRAIDVIARFRDFDDYWTPFLTRIGVAPVYAISLGVAERDALRERTHSSLPYEADGSIRLIARAWAVSGSR
jgi:hypothetical protein